MCNPFQSIAMLALSSLLLLSASKSFGQSQADPFSQAEQLYTQALKEMKECYTQHIPYTQPY